MTTRRIFIAVILLLLLVVALSVWMTRNEPERIAVTLVPREEARWGVSPFNAAPSSSNVESDSIADGDRAGPEVNVAPEAVKPSQWKDNFEAARARFDDLRWFGEDQQRLIEQARQAEAELPALVAQGHVRPGEALLLKADLLEVLQPDPNRRREALLRWWAEHPLPRPMPAVNRSQWAEVLRREEAAVAEWQTQPSVDRDLRDLDERLQQLWGGHRQP
jgi:hypothetical protein